MNEDDVKREIESMLNNRKQKKQWMEKEFSQDYMEAAYEPDDGPLSDAQVYQIRKLNMNKLIKQLAEQAGYSKDFLAIGLPNNMEKFAELIVLECAGVADHSNVTGKSIIGQRIKEHFGVKDE